MSTHQGTLKVRHTHFSSQNKTVGSLGGLTGGLRGTLEWYLRVDSMGRVPGGLVAVRLYVKHLRFLYHLLKVSGVLET
jgi:hypothetical protein